MNSEMHHTGITRRRFMKDGVLVPLALVLAGGSISTLFLRRADARGFYLRPPGALEEGRFLGACIKCGKCFETCNFSAIIKD